MSISGLLQTSFSHVRREGNVVVHALAQGNVVVHALAKDVPLDILHFVIDDFLA